MLRYLLLVSTDERPDVFTDSVEFLRGGLLSRTERESLFLRLISRDFLFPHRAADDFEFEEPAFERAVEEWRAPAGRQTNQFGQTQIRREEVRTPAGEFLLQAIAEPQVKRDQMLLITELLRALAEGKSANISVLLLTSRLR